VARGGEALEGGGGGSQIAALEGGAGLRERGRWVDRFDRGEGDHF
jgi:hypothetical protein